MLEHPVILAVTVAVGWAVTSIATAVTLGAMMARADEVELGLPE